MRRTLLFSSCLVLSLSLHVPALGQTPVSDPQALALAAKSIAAMTGRVTITDVILSGTVASLVGGISDSGTVTLMAKGSNESRIDYALAKKRTEVRNISFGIPQGIWTSVDGSSHTYAPHNCWTEAVWFFPALSSLSRNDPSTVLAYIGQETRNGASVYHLQSYRYVPNKKATVVAVLQRLSTVDFYLDVTSLLPLAMTFNTHPDNDQNPNLLVETRFGGYMNFQGILVPTHIQQSLDGNSILDLVVNAASFNTELSDSVFGLQ